MDDEILKTVQSIFGTGVKIVDCEKTSSVRQEEVLLINGIPVQLGGSDSNDADAIKAALLTGQMPSVELLNQVLYKAGLLRKSVQLETSLSVKSSMTTKEEVSVVQDGRVLDERITETRENYTHQSNKNEVFQPRLPKKQKAYAFAAGISSPKRAEMKRRESLEPCRSTTFAVFAGEGETCSDIACVGRHTSDDKISTRQATDAGNLCGSSCIYNSNTVSSLASTLSNYSINLTESSNVTTLASGASDLSALSNHTINSDFTTEDFCKRSSCSYDSGHDGVSYSASDRSPNSLLSYSDLLSSTLRSAAADEGTKPVESSTQNLVSLRGTGTHHVERIAKSQMLPTSTKGSSAGSNSASVNQEYNTKATSMGNHSNSTTINATKSAPTILTLSKRLEHVNDADSEKCSKNGKCKYQYIKPQTLITEKQSHQEVDELTQQHSLIYYDGQLVSGSLEKLIEHMVPTCTYYPDKNFIISFLLSARLFIRPHELLSKISTKWEQQQQQQEASFDVLDDAQMFANCVQTSSSVSSFKGSVAGGAETNSKRKHHQELSRQLSAQNCIRLLAEWIETFPYDFRDERLMQQVRILARKCVYIDNALGKQVSCILQLLVQRLTVLEKYEEFLQSLETAHQKNFGSKISVVSTHIALGKNLHSANATDSKLTAAPAIENTHKTFQSSLSIGSSSRTHSVESHIQNSYRQQQNDNSTNSVNLTLHHLSGHFTNSNSASSINEDPGIMDFGLSPAQLAHQLTAIELERLSHIGPEEFVQAFAKEYIANQTFVGSREQDNACGSAKHAFRATLNDIKITQNLEAYVQWFNRLSYFTATEIVKYPKKKQRVRAIEYWIETARECFNIGNFNSLVAIIAGLNLAPIARLKKTWCKVQSAKFSVLEHQMDPTSNFSSYRSTLKAAMWRSEGATNERERIIIPFFSLFVKDLYFLNEGCSNRLSNNHINFEKCSQLSKQVMEFIEWKKVACPFEKLPSVIMFLQSSAVMNENMLSIASFECEPPENTQEKGRYKTLKSETKHQMQQQLHDQQQ